jgi:hypothetical protein
VFDRKETPDELVSIEILEADRVLPGRYEIELSGGDGGVGGLLGQCDA